MAAPEDSRSTSASPDVDAYHPALETQTLALRPKASVSLTDLPTELLAHICSYVSPWTLARISGTCRLLRTVAKDKLLWEAHVRELHLPQAKGEGRVGKGQDAKHPRSGILRTDSNNDEPSSANFSHTPFGSWFEMYAAHAPYWHLVKQRVWFADRLTGHQELIGQVALARYDDRMGNIEMIRLKATLPRHRMIRRWEFDHRVVIYSFEPRVSLQMDDIILRLEPGSYGEGPRLNKQIDLPEISPRYRHGMHCEVMLTRRNLTNSRVPTSYLWPPTTVPHTDRVRRLTPSQFLDDQDKPEHYEEICDTAFRTRMWSRFTGVNGGLGIRIGEEIATWTSLPEAAYTPTPEKPYQGIWIGDYAAHGPEFVLITQKSAAETEAAGYAPIQPMSEAVREKIGFPRRQDLAVVPYNAQVAAAALNPSTVAAAADTSSAPTDPSGSTSTSPAPSGRLEAIKLTGDPNVPRAQYTFVSEDIGAAGLVRIAEEDPFAGARIVKSWGHLATDGFTVDGWIHAHLILVSPNRIAQYWIETGHIAWFRRVDWMGLITGELESADGIVHDPGDWEEWV